MRIAGHIILDAAALFLTLGLPFVTSDTGRRILSGETDAVSGASVILDQPSGEYLVLINTARHRNAENLALWETFFTGDDAPVIFEDITCLTAAPDSGGNEIAQSCRSRLPENQMTVHAIDATLLFSKAEAGLFDVIVLSEEVADAFHAETVTAMPDVMTLRVRG